MQAWGTPYGPAPRTRLPSEPLPPGLASPEDVTIDRAISERRVLAIPSSYHGQTGLSMGSVGRIETTTAPDTRPRRSAREQILDTAYGLFTDRRIRAVGVDEVIARSGVAKATLYKHFRSKNGLALAFLERREQRWTLDFIEAGSAERADDPEDQLLAIFDMLDEWYRRKSSFRECSFMSVLLEMGNDHPVGQACVRHLANIREIVARRAAAAGLTEPEEFGSHFTS